MRIPRGVFDIFARRVFDSFNFPFFSFFFWCWGKKWAVNLSSTQTFKFDLSVESGRQKPRTENAINFKMV